MAQRTRTQSRRRKHNRAPLIIAIVGGVLMIMALGLAFAGSGGTEQAVGIPLLDGGNVEIANYNGHVLLVNFWASWCPPCRAEMPTLEAYYQQHQPDGLELLMINSGESEATARLFMQENDFDFTVGLDPTNQLSNQYQIAALPVTLVFNKDGDLVYRHSGLISWPVLEAEVTPLITQ